jgi:hypothetical protein
MGEAENIRIAVVTPYYKESATVLRECIASVARQTYPCTHFLVADGHPQNVAALSSGTTVEHIVLSRAHRDIGNTPRAIGSLSAMNQGYDGIAYLDADNWYYPGHIAAMVALRRAGRAAVCTATRTIHRLDGSLMYTDLHDSNGRDHVDTSCLFLTRSAFSVLPIWAMMPAQLGPVGDRIFWGAIRGRGYATAHCSEPTVAFRTQYQVHYQAIGELPPPGSKSNAESTKVAYAWWTSLPARERNALARYLGLPAVLNAGGV